jgi:hypothetical protein
MDLPSTPKERWGSERAKSFIREKDSRNTVRIRADFPRHITLKS